MFVRKITFYLDHPRASFFATKPPVHFHSFQGGYIKVVEGIMAVEVERCEVLLSAADPEFRILPRTNHHSYPALKSHQQQGSVVRVSLSREKYAEVFELTTLFFENYYKYQNDVVMKGGAISITQLMSVSLPSSSLT